MLTKVEAHNLQPSFLEMFLEGNESSLDPIQIRNIVGIGPVKAFIDTVPYAFDGEAYSGSSIGKRNIVLTLGLNPNWVDQSMASLRQMLYKYFMPKQVVTLYFFSTHLPTVSILGYVEDFTPNIFSKDPEIQISIICPSPDFIDLLPTIITGITGYQGSALNNTHAPSTNPEMIADLTVIDYIGSVSTGFTLVINRGTGLGDYVNNVFTIINITPFTNIREIFQFRSELSDNYKVEFSSLLGSKYIRNNYNNGQFITNQLPGVTEISKWSILKPGLNSVGVKIANSDDHVWSLEYFNRFGGL